MEQGLSTEGLHQSSHQSAKLGRMTITEFLLARIAEEEERARLWRETWARDGGVMDLALTPGPARVLAQCKAHRQIVGLATAPYLYSDKARVVHNVSIAPILHALASVYANHPDFDPTWKP